MTDDFDADFGVDEWHGTNAFIRDGDRVFRTYFINSRGDEALGSTWSYLDMTALGRQEEWEDSPEGYPQTPTYEWWIWHDEPATTDADRPGLVQLRIAQAAAAARRRTATPRDRPRRRHPGGRDLDAVPDCWRCRRTSGTCLAGQSLDPPPRPTWRARHGALTRVRRSPQSRHARALRARADFAARSGGGRIRTSEGRANGFTARPLWPLGNTPRGAGIVAAPSPPG